MVNVDTNFTEIDGFPTATDSDYLGTPFDFTRSNQARSVVDDLTAFGHLLATNGASGYRRAGHSLASWRTVAGERARLDQRIAAAYEKGVSTGDLTAAEDKIDAKQKSRSLTLTLATAATMGALFFLYQQIAAGQIHWGYVPPALVAHWLLAGWYGRDRNRPVINKTYVNYTGASEVRREDLIRALIDCVPKVKTVDQVIVLSSRRVPGTDNQEFTVRLEGGATYQNCVDNLLEIAADVDWDPNRFKIGEVKDTSHVRFLFLAERPELQMLHADPVHPLFDESKPGIYNPVDVSTQKATIGFWVNPATQATSYVDLSPCYNTLIGGQPGNGKTTIALSMGAFIALCPFAYWLLIDFKMADDYDELGPVANTWIEGPFHDSYAQASKALQWVLAVIDYRRLLMKSIPQRLKSASGKGISPAIMNDPEWGQHFYPVFIDVEEIWRFFKTSPFSNVDTQALEEISREGRQFSVFTWGTSQNLNKEVMPRDSSSNFQSRISTKTENATDARQLLGTVPKGKSPATLPQFEGYVSAEDRYRRFRNILLSHDQLVQIADEARRRRRESGLVLFGPNGEPLPSSLNRSNEANGTIDLEQFESSDTSSVPFHVEQGPERLHIVPPPTPTGISGTLRHLLFQHCGTSTTVSVERLSDLLRAAPDGQWNDKSNDWVRSQVKALAGCGTTPRTGTVSDPGRRGWRVDELQALLVEEQAS